MSVRLDELPARAPAAVTGVDWESLSDTETRRLRDLGLDEGVTVELLHTGLFGRDPIAVRIGSMTVAIRRSVARLVSVQP